MLGMPFNDFVSFGNCQGWSSQQMNVVRHDHEGMQNVVFEVGGVVLDGFDYHVGDGRLPPGKPGGRADCHGDAR